MKHTINTKKIYMNSIETTLTSLTEIISFLARNTSELNKYHSLAKSIVERRRAEILPQKISRRNNKIKISVKKLPKCFGQSSWVT